MVYQFNQSPSEANQLGNYWLMLAASTIIGKGDGSDGKHNNLPDIAGTPVGIPQLWIAPNPGALAVQVWDGASTPPTTPIPGRSLFGRRSLRRSS